ncbi:hypothetical protein TNCV_4514001 [Trichonephila clavipes]|nr:hypothetical protein TNCV_4514001 [Trichonephila clavipes]
MKGKENFQMLPKELHQLKYEAISVPHGPVHLVKKEKSNLLFVDHQRCHELEPSTTKTRRVGERCTLNLSRAQTPSCWSDVVVKIGQLKYRSRHLTMVQNYKVRLRKRSCS